MKTIIAIPFERRRKRMTNYRKRLKLIKSSIDRLVIRKTSTQIIVQVARFGESGDAVVFSVSSTKLRKHGWSLGTKNIPAAYLTGYMAGKLAISKKVQSVILDAGMSKPVAGGRLYAALKGVKEAGVDVKVSDEAAKAIFPADDRLGGKHIAQYLSSLPSLTHAQSQFSLYAKNKVSSQGIPKMIESVKANISGERHG